MKRQNLFEQVAHLKELFTTFRQHKKKVKALENFSQAEPVAYRDEVRLIKLCMSSRFLSAKGAAFLEELLEEHEIAYLDWAHRTKWLKQEIAKRKGSRPRIEQGYFDFEAQEIASSIPVGLIGAMKRQPAARMA